MWLHSSVGRASPRYRGGHGFESRWSPSCLNWKNYYDDHSSLSLFNSPRLTSRSRQSFPRASLTKTASSKEVIVSAEKYPSFFSRRLGQLFIELENTILVKFMRNYIRDLTGVFSTSSLVKTSMTSFPACSRLLVKKATKHGERD